MNRQGLWYFISNYKFNSVFIRNLILIIIVITIPFMLLVYNVYYQMNQAVKDEVSATSQSTLYHTVEIVDTLIRDSNRLAAQLTLKEDVKMFLLTDYIFESRAARVNTLIKMYSDTMDYIDSIYIYSELNHNIFAREYFGHVDNFQEKSWYQYYEKIETNRMFIQPRKYNERFPYLMSLYHPVYLAEHKLGVVVININVQKLRAFIGRNFDKLYIIDNKDNSIVYSKDIYQFQMKFNELYEDIPLTPNSDISELMQIDDKQFIVSKSQLNSQDWSIVSFQPLTIYDDKLKEVGKFIIGFFTLSFLLAIIMSFVISIRTFRPIERIITALNEPEQWDKIKNKSQYNEINYIRSNIINNLESKLYLEKELDKKLDLLNKAQTLALQAQVSPHFLSNTLEAMKWMAIRLTGGENDISKMAVSLSRLLRITLGSGKQIIPVSLEIELLKRYIEIMEMRFKDKFRVLWDVDESLLEYQTVQLTLQPLIENAFLHGVRPKSKQGTITIKVKDNGSSILFEVSDDGVGIDERTLENLNKQIELMFSLEGKHIGLRNVNQRIKLIFGEKYGLEIKSKEDYGTTVTILLPKIK